jgi:hypothetical protein
LLETATDLVSRQPFFTFISGLTHVAALDLAGILSVVASCHGVFVILMTSIPALPPKMALRYYQKIGKWGPTSVRMGSSHPSYLSL